MPSDVSAPDIGYFTSVKMKALLGLGALLGMSLAAATQPTAATNPAHSAASLKVTTKSGTRNKTAPFLHGLFFEDINVGYFSIHVTFSGLD